MNIWPGVHFIPLSSTSAEYDGVWFSAGSAPLTPVLSVCIFLVIFSASFFFCPLFTAVVFHGEFFFFTQ